MSRPVRYQRQFPWPAEKVYAATVDRGQLEARLRAMGGQNATLLEHAQTDTGTRFRLQHGLAAADLPPIARAVLPEDLLIERTESWRVDAPGSYGGDVQVRIPGMPATIDGGMTLTGNGPDGCELRIDAKVGVQLPFIGGKVEEVVAGQIVELLAAETAFTEQWITS